MAQKSLQFLNKSKKNAQLTKGLLISFKKGCILAVQRKSLSLTSEQEFFYRLIWSGKWWYTLKVLNLSDVGIYAKL